MPISQIFLPEDILRRYSDIINLGAIETHVRSRVLQSLGNLPVYKKKAFGNQRDE